MDRAQISLESSAGLDMQNDSEQLRQEAHEHLQAQRWSEANTAFRTLLQQNEEDEDALIGLALAQDRLGQYEMMLDTAERALDLNPNSAQALACKARALQKLERISEATIANDQALLLDTHLALAWFNRSGQQLLQGHPPEALRYALRAIELDSRDPRTWANKGLALYQLNRSMEALEAINSSLALDPDYVVALETKGHILRRYARLPEVVETMRQALEVAPDNVDCLQLMTYALRTLGEYEDLLEVTEKLVQLTPDSLFTWESHMYALRGLARFEEALEAIDHVLELVPDNERYWMIKADNFYRMQRYREALSAADKALQIDAEYAPARRIRDKVTRLMYQQKGKRKR